MADIRVICAIGLRGQLGLRGAMPWEGDPRREFRADVARFFELTRGHVIAAGPATARSIPDFARHDRTIVELRSSDRPGDLLDRFRDRVVFIGGGPPVWAAYAQYVRHWDITRLPYDGEADRWFDPAWLTSGAPAEVSVR
ncbi:diacylglycerol kinase [Enterovirga sp. CN4-39]|uniref:diacylglycerol kinase n=1 Tax=Enterovirga sp. CN4-39 TaxID=3400910 RepID=UPI003BFD9B1C